MTISRKELDRRRETRLWIVQIGIPLLSAFATLYNVPEFRTALNEKKTNNLKPLLKSI